MEDYTITTLDGLTGPNVEKLKQLSPEAFREYYFRKMRKYPWWEKGGTRKCDECGYPITKPEDLRRYNGNSLHSACFSTFRSREKGTEDTESREYFDMVEAIVPVS
jgi:hypothetical protein